MSDQDNEIFQEVWLVQIRPVAAGVWQDKSILMTSRVDAVATLESLDASLNRGAEPRVVALRVVCRRITCTEETTHAVGAMPWWASDPSAHHSKLRQILL